MTTGLIIIGLVWVAVSVPMIALGVIRVQKGPQPWTLLDAALAFVGLIWMATGPSVFVFVASADSVDALKQTASDPDAGLALALIGTSMLGTMTAAAFAWLRAGRAAMRLVRLENRWLLISALLVLPLSGVFWLGEKLVGLLGLEVDPQMVSVATSELDSGPSLVLMLFLVVLVAPVFEEIVFRGFIQPVLVRRTGLWAGVGLTAMIFGLIHASDPHAVGPVVVLGMALGWLRERTDTLTAPIVLHVVNNASAMLMVRLLGV